MSNLRGGNDCWDCTGLWHPCSNDPVIKKWLAENINEDGRISKDAPQCPSYDDVWDNRYKLHQGKETS